MSSPIISLPTSPATPSSSLTTPPETTTTTTTTPSSTPSETSPTTTSPLTTTTSTSTTSSESSTNVPPSSSSSLPPSDTSSSTFASPSGGGGSSSSSSSTSLTSAPVSTIVQTTIITVNGQTTAVVTTSIESSTSAAAGSSSGSGGGSNNTGAIVGGVVGGIVAIAALVLLTWCFIRRRKRNEFDGNFDPDNVAQRDSIHRLGRGGDADLLAAARVIENEPELTPYTYGATGSMSQAHPGGASILGPAAAGGVAGYAAGRGGGVYDQKTVPPSSFYDPNAPSSMPSGPSETGSHSTSGRGWGDPRTNLSGGGVPYGASPYPPGGGLYAPGPVPRVNTPSDPTTQSGSTYGSSKEREAFAQRYGPQGPPGGVGTGPSAGGTFAVQNATEEPGVVVHQDGGRVRDENNPPNEIPPAYESIRPDDERQKL